MRKKRRTARGRARALGILAGVALDRVVADPRRGHPVALFGSAAARLERLLYAPSRPRGAVFTAAAVAPVTAAGALACARAGHGRAFAVTAAATWAVVGGAMLEREAEAMADALEAGDVAAARRRLPHLCGRDPSGLDADALARATVESVAENTSDAVVAPLVWGALLGPAGLLGYRAVNTLDAMVGHRSRRYERFGWAAARLDDVANWAPARLTALLAVAAAPVVGGDPRRAWRTCLRYGDRHPSPNAGPCESAFAGALGVRLGGRNVYGERVEERPRLGDGRPPEVGDIRRAVRLTRAVTTGAALLSAVAAGILAGSSTRRGKRG
ncbi:cobalamin biosynthesis protein [Thermobifida halotolerans]|uniref:Cobalamin biosynthesis protein CobD n=1 Tax=Thermobifida halotolerans TaxID=483545 RepID=A0AA97M2G5_9ACTN|nr:cobalamin biosynthesis protein [Thermobifida halotolerans]UOE17942.1 cobalamin biosynthesis protein [Thermobifida halotolerans]